MGLGGRGGGAGASWVSRTPSTDASSGCISRDRPRGTLLLPNQMGVPQAPPSFPHLLCAQ